MKTATIFASILFVCSCVSFAQVENFSGRLFVRPQWTNSLVSGVATVTETTSTLLDQYHTSGTNVNQMNAFIRALWTLTNSESRTLSFATATNSFGNVLNIYRVNAIAVKSASSNTATIAVGGDTFADWIGGGTTSSVTVRPSGLLLLTAPDATGYNSSGKVFKITNGSTNNSTVEIYIGGAK